jgi:FkbM family methyltransferase
LKSILKVIRNNSSFNKVIRSAVKSFAFNSNKISKKLTLYWPVSGIVEIKKSHFSFKLKSEGNDALTNKLYYEQSWEDEIIELFKNLISKTKVFYDVGANIGIFSLLAEQLSPNTDIYCFEPNPVNVKRIKSNLKINKSTKIKVVPKAIGEKQGNLKFYVPKGNYTSDVSSFFNAHTKGFNDFGTEAIDVEVISLDDFTKENKSSPNLIKIDIELYEYQALKGSLNILKEGSPLIIIELFNDVVKRTINPELDNELEQGLTLKTERLLSDYGYHFYLISNKGLLFVENLHSNPDSSMYLLTKQKLNKIFYLKSEFQNVAKELFK